MFVQTGSCHLFILFSMLKECKLTLNTGHNSGGNVIKPPAFTLPIKIFDHHVLLHVSITVITSATVPDRVIVKSKKSDNMILQ